MGNVLSLRTVCLALLLSSTALVGLGCPKPQTCSPTALTGTSIAAGVTYYDCSQSEPAVHIVTMDRSLSDSEIWLLADRNSTPQSFNLQTAPWFAERFNAVVTINGYTWAGDKGNGEGTGLPVTTTFVDGVQQSSNTSHCNGFPDPCPEVLMGFRPGGTSIDAKRIPQDDFALPANLPYRYQLYGSNSSVMGNGECFSEGSHERWSVIGYSDTQIVFLSTATGKSYRQQEFCTTLSAFGVTEAVRQDGSSAASLYVGGSVARHVNPITGAEAAFYGGSARHVAYALGLVTLHPIALINSGFEEPTIEPPWIRFESIPGWTGLFDLHSTTDLVGHDAQIVDLNQNDSGYIETSFEAPLDTACVASFFHGVNHHCTQQAELSVDIDGSEVARFTSSYSPDGLEQSQARFRTGSSSTVRLRFSSLTRGCGAATIDDVTVACTR